MTTPDPGEVIHHWQDDGWLDCCKRWYKEMPYWTRYVLVRGLATCTGDDSS